MSQYEKRTQLAGYVQDLQDGRDNFGALLMQLIQKADAENSARLAKGFPEAVQFYDDWLKSPDGPAFMKEALGD